MAYDAKAIANAFLDLAEEAGTSLTPMKLQKLIYFAHGWNLAVTGEPLIADQIEAWDFGPVVPSIYHEFKAAQSGPIKSRATTFDFGELEFVPVTMNADDDATRQVLLQVWNTYGRLTANQLSRLTHLPGTPWAQVQLPGARNVPIPDELIARYFKDSLEQNRERQQAAG